MPLFANNNDQLSLVNPLIPTSERTLQRLLEKNLPETLGLHFIATEYRTSTGGRIDTLALDGDGTPVIIEYKRTRNDNVINQSLSYLKWIKAQPQDFFEMLMHKRMGNQIAESIKLDWRNPRVICIAESFSRFDLDTAQVVPLKIDLFKYTFYENGLFRLDQVNFSEQSSSEVLPEAPLESGLATIEAMKNQASSTHQISELYDELRERILTMDQYIVEKPGKRVIAYKLNKIFCEILIRKDKIGIDLRPIDYVDPLGMVERIGEGYVITMNRRVFLTEFKDLDYVSGLIEQSYQNVL